MLRAYVVDDERLAVQRLTRLLEASGRVEIAGSATDPEAALEFLNAHAVDVLFLDIQMPGLTGFELLERLDAHPLVIFTTAYDRYARQRVRGELDRLSAEADRAGAPRARARQARTSARHRAGCGVWRGHSCPARSPRAARGNLPRSWRRRSGSSGSRRGSASGRRCSTTARISHFVARDKLTFAIVNGREHVIDYTLTDLEQRLDARRFVRIHRAHGRQRRRSCRSCFRRSTAACWCG